MDFALWISFTKVVDPKPCSLKTGLLRKDFDLLCNSRPTVPMYADERELLVFRTFSQSFSVPKRVFRHAEARCIGSVPVFGNKQNSVSVMKRKWLVQELAASPPDLLN